MENIIFRYTETERVKVGQTGRRSFLPVHNSVESSMSSLWPQALCVNKRPSIFIHFFPGYFVSGLNAVAYDWEEAKRERRREGSKIHLQGVDY